MPRGAVATYSVPGHGFAHSHERATRDGIARRLAVLKSFDFVGEYNSTHSLSDPVYLVPSDTLVGLAAAAALGVRDEHDLFGGTVPHPFIATKAITHPLVAPGATAPPGWSPEFGARVQGAVLAGVTAFSDADVRSAAKRLLEYGPVRIKPVWATGGRGQIVVSDLDAMEAVIDTIDAVRLAEDGLVLEENLTEVTTFSVGQVRVADLIASYYGTQRLPPDNSGTDVYGGSDLVVARGDFEAWPHSILLRMRGSRWPARVYDQASTECFAGMFASRRNYDIGQGLDAAGRLRCGVLEQSWRIGGASGAEVAALETFRANPGLRAVRASTVEIYGDAEPPPDATVYFQGVDERDGPMTKYARTEPHHV